MYKHTTFPQQGQALGWGGGGALRLIPLLSHLLIVDRPDLNELQKGPLPATGRLGEKKLLLIYQNKNKKPKR